MTQRRRLLKRIGTLGIVAIAGCTTLNGEQTQTATTPEITPPVSSRATQTPTPAVTDTPTASPPVTQVTKLLPRDGATWGAFGGSVAVSSDGTTALIGASGDEDPNGQTGSAYVFSRADGSWTQNVKLTADDGEQEDFFGGSVAVAGDGTTALIGASGDDGPNGQDAGSAYVFSRGGGTWTQKGKLTDDDGEQADVFGDSVAVAADGTTALVGASGDENPNGQSAGSAYVFE